ncbi:MAG: hypothetical protein WBX25_37525, partial [Rhodomicrobium sp.]
ACCNEKGVCEKDLRKHPQDPVWQSYCPNAFTLLDLKKLKTSNISSHSAEGASPGLRSGAVE